MMLKNRVRVVDKQIVDMCAVENNTKNHVAMQWKTWKVLEINNVQLGKCEGVQLVKVNDESRTCSPLPNAKLLHIPSTCPQNIYT